MTEFMIRLAVLTSVLVSAAGCSNISPMPPKVDHPKLAGPQEFPPETLKVGEATTFKLEDVGIEATLVLTAAPDLFELEFTMDVRGDWSQSVPWDQKELAARLLFDGGREFRGWNRSAEGLIWMGCACGWQTKTSMVFARPDADGRPRILEIKVYGSHRVFRVEFQ